MDAGLCDIRRKGIHFDKRGKTVERYQDLVEIGGVFNIEDVERRLPLDLEDLERLHQHGLLDDVFYVLGRHRFVDITKLNDCLCALMKPCGSKVES